ncbi:MAG TPA: TRIC cation channel family protein [Thermoleophilaceae bacterium]|nr:TRIC cation channel family protein [Thermoleophilaceae bacterium]
MLPGFDPDLIRALSIAGTFVFGLTGGIVGVRKRLDLFGVVVLAVAVGMAGGIVRDVLIGRPPETFRDWRYLAAAGAAGVVALLAPRALQRLQRSLDVVDAAGLALFSVAGASTALAFDVPPAQAALLGAVTGIGGGILRDILVNEIPEVLRGGLYALPALLGAAVVVVASEAGSQSAIFPVLGMLACFGVRLVAIRHDINLPQVSAVRAAPPDE